jgi:hypothetical protein
LDRTIYSILRKSTWVLPGYRISGCITYNHGDLVAMKLNYIPNNMFQNKFNELLNLIEDKLNTKSPFSVIRAGDGEAYFLRGKYIGNVSRRHLTKSTSKINSKLWKERYLKNDLLCYDANRDLRLLWIPIVGSDIKKNYFPLHAVYALIATKKLFPIIQNRKVGLVGGQNKLKLIQNLFNFSEYRDYLNLSHVNSYIPVPEMGACNDPDRLLSDIISAAKANPCDIYLVATGIFKIYMMSVLRDELNCVVIDIGSGMDALAGVIPKDRQCFGSWINFKDSTFKINCDLLSTHSRMIDTYHHQEDVVLRK